jgi:hypothetical protein
MNRTLPIIVASMQPRCGRVRFDRFSPYFMRPDDFGLKLEPFEFYGFCYPFPQQSLKSMAYYFQDTNHEVDYLGDLAGAIAGLRKTIARWRTLWVDDNDATAPRLRLSSDGDRHVVEDTRSGAPVRIPVSQRELELLRDTERPADEEHVAASFGDTLDVVRRKRLIFSERGRVMSIVVLPDHDGVDDDHARREPTEQDLVETSAAEVTARDRELASRDVTATRAT